MPRTGGRPHAASLRRYPGGLDHLVPIRLIVSEKFRELVRRHCRRHAAVFTKSRDDRGFSDGVFECRVEQRHDFGRRVSRCEHAIPDVDVITRHGLGDRRHVGQQRPTLGRSDAERAQRAGAHHLENRAAEIVEKYVDFAGHEVGIGGRRPAIGTWTMSIFVRNLKYSPDRCGEAPTPEEAIDICPGWALA